MSCYNPRYDSIDHEKPLEIRTKVWVVCTCLHGFFISYLSPNMTDKLVLDESNSYFDNPFDAYFWLMENVKGEIV